MEAEQFGRTVEETDNELRINDRLRALRYSLFNNLIGLVPSCLAQKQLLACHNYNNFKLERPIVQTLNWAKVYIQQSDNTDEF